MIGRGLKWAWGMVNSCGGEESLELFEFEFPAKFRMGIGENVFDFETLVSKGPFDWSLLLERDLGGGFFFDFSATDLDRGRPIFGSSPNIGFLVGGTEKPSCGDRLSRKEMGEGEPERLPGEPLLPWCRLKNVFQSKGFELLKLKFLLPSSSDGDASTMGLCGTAGVRKVPPMSSEWALRFFPGFPSSGNVQGRTFTRNS